MYSSKLIELFSREGILQGDTIQISSKEIDYIGILLPRSDLGNSDCVVLKLENGYNVGILYSSGVKISLVDKARKVKKTKDLKLIPDSSVFGSLKPDVKKPYISLISTGGTIASKVDYRTGGVTGLMSPHEIIERVPRLKDISKIDFSSPFTKMSEDMDSKDWSLVAKECANKLNSGAQGVIVTHGTDFLHFTAAALSFMLRDLSGPVVLTGSQRSSDRGSSDASLNLICSAIVATSNIAEVGICMHGTLNDDYCLFLRGTKVRKMHTSRRDAFRPINDFPLARAFPDGTIETLNAYQTRGSSKTVLKNKFEDKVALIKAYPGSDPGLIDYFVDKKYRGIVIEAGALGHVPVNGNKSWISSIARAVDNGVVVCATSQCLYGRIHPHVYSNLRKVYHHLGVVPLEDMLCETAYVKLGWALGNYKGLQKIKEIMTTNICGEITQNSYPHTFLY